jgi:hypothetical protein
MITFPRKPEKTVMSATFDIDFGGKYTVKVTKTMNGVIDYACELLTEGVEPAVKDFIEKAVVNEAKKHGVFEPETKGS